MFDSRWLTARGADIAQWNDAHLHIPKHLENDPAIKGFKALGPLAADVMSVAAPGGLLVKGGKGRTLLAPALTDTLTKRLGNIPGKIGAAIADRLMGGRQPRLRRGAGPRCGRPCRKREQIYHRGRNVSDR